MAGSFSDYLENKLLDHVFKTTAFTVPAVIYVALFTTAPTDAGGGTEVSGGAYGRVVCNTWDAASGGAIENTATVTFTAATSAWGTVVAAAAYDATTAGNLLAWGDLITNRSVGIGDTANFTAGAIDITLD